MTASQSLTLISGLLICKMERIYRKYSSKDTEFDPHYDPNQESYGYINRDYVAYLLFTTFAFLE